MLKRDALKYFEGSTRKLGECLGLSTQTVYKWGDVVPAKQALRLEVLTNGELKTDTKLYL